MNDGTAIFLKSLRQYPGAVAAILAMIALQAATVALVPWPLKLIIDNVLGNLQWPDALGWMAGMGVWLACGILVASAFALRAIGQLMTAWLSVLTQRTSSVLKLTLARRLFAHMLALDHGFHVEAKTGDLTQRITSDTAFPNDMLTGVLIPGITAFFTLSFSAFVLATMSPLLAMMLLVLVMPVPFVLAWFQRRIIERSYAQSDHIGGLMALAGQVLSSVQVIKSFNRETQTEREFRQRADEVVDAALALKAPAVQANFIVGMIQGMAMAIMLVAGGLLVVRGDVTLGTLALLLGYVQSVLGPVASLSTIASAHATALGKARRIAVILDRKPAVRDRPDARPLTRQSRSQLPPELSFSNITFGYSPGRPVLQDVSFTVHPGETVALTGHTGAGKSTIASLIMRMIDPQKGTVAINGQDIRNFQLDSLRRAMGVVLQETYLVPGSFAENIGLGREGLSRPEIEQAARDAQAHGFITASAEGYDTLIGPGGKGLSGGQRQRIALARAIARDASVLILDEPTSALDVETEASIFDALAAASQGRTTLIIAHRMSTLSLANRVLRLENGKIAEIALSEAICKIVT